MIDVSPRILPKDRKPIADPAATITIEVNELERLIRRVVREELARVHTLSDPAPTDDWEQEGPDDPAGDEELLAEAVALLESYSADKSGWMSLDEFKTELARAEAAGELPA